MSDPRSQTFLTSNRHIYMKPKSKPSCHNDLKPQTKMRFL